MIPTRTLPPTVGPRRSPRTVHVRMGSKPPMDAPGPQPGSCQGLTQVPDEQVDEAVRIRERHEVATGDLVDTRAQSFPRDAALEVDREEPIVSAGDHVNRNV